MASRWPDDLKSIILYTTSTLLGSLSKYILYNIYPDIVKVFFYTCIAQRRSHSWSLEAVVVVNWVDGDGQNRSPITGWYVDVTQTRRSGGASIFGPETRFLHSLVADDVFELHLSFSVMWRANILGPRLRFLRRWSRAFSMFCSLLGRVTKLHSHHPHSTLRYYHSGHLFSTRVKSESKSDNSTIILEHYVAFFT